MYLDGSGEFMDQISELKKSMKWLDSLNAIFAVSQITLIFIEVRFYTVLSWFCLSEWSVFVQW